MAASVEGISWPTVSAVTPAAALAVAEELEATQWLSAGELRDRQRMQAALVTAHAIATVPHYRGLSSIPIMTRPQIIAAGSDLLSRAYPSTHGPAPEVATSRSSGEPVRVRGTGVVGVLNAALTLRDHRWHRRDLKASHAAVRYAPDAQHGIVTRGWNPITALIAPDALGHVLSIIGTSTDEQLAWLEKIDPTYFLTYPSVLAAIVRRADRTKLSALRQLRTFGEILPAATRELARAVLGVPVVDMYSAQEVGPIALQCPDHEHYHVQEERLLVEILRDDDTPCSAGEVGRVVITDLHNFATPILRYDIGDRAEVGESCPCGRSSLVLKRIVGRVRNLLTYPDGRTVFPLFTVGAREAARYRDIQLVQVTRDTLCVRVVPDPGFSLDQAALAAALHRSLGHPFELQFEIVDELARSPAGKLEEFISRI